MIEKKKREVVKAQVMRRKRKNIFAGVENLIVATKMGMIKKKERENSKQEVTQNISSSLYTVSCQGVGEDGSPQLSVFCSS